VYNVLLLKLCNSVALKTINRMGWSFRTVVSIVLFFVGVAYSDDGRKSTPAYSSAAALLALQEHMQVLEATVADQRAIIQVNELACA